MLPFLSRLEEIVSLFLQLIPFGFAEYNFLNVFTESVKAESNRWQTPVTLAFYVNITAVFYSGDAFSGGQFRSKEWGRIYTDWHHFCNHELIFHNY